MCPYARFQSVMFDRDTLIITYDAARGEPRGSRREERRPARGGPRRLRRLRHLRAGLPDRHRHPQRPAVRVHRLRRLHRRLRPGDGQDGLPARADPLLDRQRAGAGATRRRRCCGACSGRACSLYTVVAARGQSRRSASTLVPARAAEGGRDPRPRRRSRARPPTGVIENVYRLQIMNTERDAARVTSCRLAGLPGAELAVAQPLEVPAAGTRTFSAEVRIGPAPAMKAGSSRSYSTSRPRMTPPCAATSRSPLSSEARMKMPLPTAMSSRRPWYREPWPWMLMAGPLAVVLAGIVTCGSPWPPRTG